MSANLQTMGVSYAPLMDWLLGPVRQALLQSALELDLPGLLTETGDPQALSRRLGAHQGNLVRLLDGLTALGLAEKHDGHYANTPLADLYLRRDRQTWLGDMLLSLIPMQQANLGRLGELTLHGPPEVKGEKRLDSPEHWQRAARYLANYQRAGLGRLAADLAEALPEFPGFRLMLDLGGGPGLVGAAILERHPPLHCVLCDQPPVVAVAQELAQSQGLAGRMSFIAGDYNQVDLGQGYDLIWASHCLYYVKERTALMKRLLEALNAGGVLLCLHEGLTNQRSAPPYYVLSRLSLAMEGQDVSFDQGELAEHMRQAGFAQVESRPMELATGLTWLDVGRKARRS